ncbi:MAG: hypothetical protein HYU65_06395 [Armatimonadetes bacterium]|nr:hypothetical protein [Armatimonadota bacterium]
MLPALTEPLRQRRIERTPAWQQQVQQIARHLQPHAPLLLDRLHLFDEMTVARVHGVQPLGDRVAVEDLVAFDEEILQQDAHRPSVGNQGVAHVEADRRDGSHPRRCA